MTPAPIPAGEARRLAAVHALELLDAPPEVALAVSVAEMARAAYAQGARPGGLAAVYVRPSDAELKGLCHAQN